MGWHKPEIKPDKGNRQAPVHYWHFHQQAATNKYHVSDNGYDNYNDYNDVFTNKSYAS